MAQSLARRSSRRLTRAGSSGRLLGAALSPVVLQRRFPPGASLLALALGVVRFAEAHLRVRFLGGVAEAVERRERLLVAVRGLRVIGGVQGEVAEAVRDDGLSFRVVVAPGQGQCRCAVRARLAAVVEPGLMPADLPQSPAFPHRHVKGRARRAQCGACRSFACRSFAPAIRRQACAWPRRSPAASASDSARRKCFCASDQPDRAGRVDSRFFAAQYVDGGTSRTAQIGSTPHWSL